MLAKIPFTRAAVNNVDIAIQTVSSAWFIDVKNITRKKVSLITSIFFSQPVPVPHVLIPEPMVFRSSSDDLSVMLNLAESMRTFFSFLSMIIVNSCFYVLLYFYIVSNLHTESKHKATF